MDELYDFLTNEWFSYEMVQIKNKKIIVELGCIGSNIYHAIVEHDLKNIDIYDLNGRQVLFTQYKTFEDIKITIQTFIDSVNVTKQIVTSDKDFDDIDLDDIMSMVVTKTKETTTITDNHKFKIYTYGCKNYNPSDLKMNRVYDVSQYISYIPSNFGSMRYYRGTDMIIQKMIATGGAFSQTIQDIVLDIEKNKPHTIGICCSHGKHRSVSFAELLKKYYYPDAIITHLCI
jgi:hypothetical protein